jgi:sphingomyelin phosphodiesterase
VCEGLLGTEGPVLANDIKKMKLGSDTSILFCITLVGLCDFPPIRPYLVPFPTPKPATQRPPPSGQPPIQVAHISDTHVDLSYTPGASYNCTKPICCRPYTGAEAPGNNSYPAGPFGDSHCDAPISLEQSMFAEIASMKPAFTIFTGDVVAHDVWLVDKTEVETDLHVTYAMMKFLGLVYPTIGNHDVAPVNLFPPLSLAAEGVSAQWAYDTMSTDWSSWLGKAVADDVKTEGSYSTKYPGGNLRVISFNSVFYYKLNFWIYEDPMEYDPSGQFAWLVQELQAAEEACERVWLIAHIPPGSSDFLRDYSNYFNQIVARYEATIAAMFYGHTHVDQFEISYADYEHPTYDGAQAMSYIAPSMTPTSGSPSFRTYSIDPVTFGVLDYTEYIADMDDPTFQSAPTWKKYYSAKEAYGTLLTPPVTDPAAELTPAFWHNITELFENDDAAFQAYYARKSRGFDVLPCTGLCKALEICQTRAAQSQYNCDSVQKGVHFNKRDEIPEEVLAGEQAHKHEDACEGTQIRNVFAAMTRDLGVFVKRVDERTDILKRRRL